MHAKKIIGVAFGVVLLVALGFLVVQQMSSTGSLSEEMKAPGASQEKQSPQEEGKRSLSRDTKQPATIDAILDDMSAEVGVEQSAMETEIAGESSIIEDEGASLNEVSQFYDENSL